MKLFKIGELELRLNNSLYLSSHNLSWDCDGLHQLIIDVFEKLSQETVNGYEKFLNEIRGYITEDKFASYKGDDIYRYGRHFYESLLEKNSFVNRMFINNKILKLFAKHLDKEILRKKYHLDEDKEENWANLKDAEESFFDLETEFGDIINIENYGLSYEREKPFDKRLLEHYSIQGNERLFFVPSLDLNSGLCRGTNTITRRTELLDFDGVYGVNRRDFFNFVLPFDEKPRPKFFTKGNGPTFGIELEYNKSYHMKNSDIYKEMDGFFYVKHDGSLNDGFEFVSHPFDLEWYVENKCKLERFINNVKGSTGSGTGLHVHIGRDNLTNKQIENIVYLVNHNIEERSRLSGRYSSERAHSQEDFGDGHFIENIKDSRYSAVNLVPDNTIEIRTFRNSKKLHHCLGRIELTIALAYYCKKGWQWYDFMRHCEYMKSKYGFKYLGMLIDEKIYKYNGPTLGPNRNKKTRIVGDNQWQYNTTRVDLPF